MKNEKRASKRRKDRLWANLEEQKPNQRKVEFRRIVMSKFLPKRKKKEKKRKKEKKKEREIDRYSLIHKTCCKVAVDSLC